MKISAEHLEFENDRWKRLVQFIQLENSYSKNRLAEVIKTNEPLAELLDQAEFYQNYYIQQDTHLSLLKHDLTNFGRLFEKEKFLDGAIAKNTQDTHHRLKREIEKLENGFRDMQLKFHDFVEANM
jgi:hypothetical protein